MESISVRKIVEMARFELRRYGFRADGEGVITRSGTRVEFETESATGQAAFSQNSVTGHVHIYTDKVITFDTEIPFDDYKRIIIGIGVSYTHVDGGSNGYSVRYTITNKFFDDVVMKREAYL